MATETYTSPGKRRGMTRRQAGLLAGAVALVALAVVVVEVVWPLSAGLPIGWGQYNNSLFHLHVGTPPFWNVAADSNAFPSNPGCGFIVALAPPSQAALHSTRDLEKAPLTIQVDVAAPCLDVGLGAGGQAPLWQPTGQYVVVAGQTVPLETETVDAGQVSYSVVVTAHGYTYRFILYAWATQRQQAQKDLPDFLTLARSFRYIS
jgi:hypothetical protein